MPQDHQNCCCRRRPKSPAPEMKTCLCAALRSAQTRGWVHLSQDLKYQPAQWRPRRPKQAKLCFGASKRCTPKFDCPPKCEQKRDVSADINRRRSVRRSNRRPRDPRGTPRGLSYINRLIIGRYKKPLLRVDFFARKKEFLRKLEAAMRCLAIDFFCSTSISSC